MISSRCVVPKMWTFGLFGHYAFPDPVLVPLGFLRSWRSALKDQNAPSWVLRGTA